MAFAIFLVHMKQLPTLNGQGGWALELQGMFLVTALAILCLGAGRFSMGGRSKRSEEHTSELQSLMRISYAVFCLKKKIKSPVTERTEDHTHHTLYQQHIHPINVVN